VVLRDKGRYGHNLDDEIRSADTREAQTNRSIIESEDRNLVPKMERHTELSAEVNHSKASSLPTWMEEIARALCPKGRLVSQITFPSSDLRTNRESFGRLWRAVRVFLARIWFLRSSGGGGGGGDSAGSDSRKGWAETENLSVGKEMLIVLSEPISSSQLSLSLAEQSLLRKRKYSRRTMASHWSEMESEEGTVDRGRGRLEEDDDAICWRDLKMG
jgi:hypothetical protein